MTTHDADADANPATGAPEAPLPIPEPAPARRRRPRKATGADEPDAAPTNSSAKPPRTTGAATSRTDPPARSRARKTAKTGPETTASGTAGAPNPAAPAPAPARKRQRKAANPAPRPAPTTRTASPTAAGPGGVADATDLPDAREGNRLGIATVPEPAPAPETAAAPAPEPEPVPGTAAASRPAEPVDPPSGPKLAKPGGGPAGPPPASTGGPTAPSEPVPASTTVKAEIERHDPTATHPAPGPVTSDPATTATGGPTAPSEPVPVSETVEAEGGPLDLAATHPAPGPVTSDPAPGAPEVPGDRAGAGAPGPADATAAQVRSGAPAAADVTGSPARRRLPRVRVLWLAKGLGLGGAERLLLNCARHVDRSRFDVEVAYVLPYKDALAADLERAGIPVHCLIRKPDRRRSDPLWPVLLRSLAKERGYGLVHTHMPVPAVAARLLLRGGLSVPLVHTEHNMWPRYRLPTRLANAATYGRNDAVVAVSHAVAGSIGKAARSHGEGWLNTIHHGPDLGGAPTGPDARIDARKALGVPQDAVVVGTVGNHTPKKDQRTLLDAFAVMRRNHSGTALVLIGSGPLEQRLRDHAASLGLGSSVVFAGARTDVPALLPGLDVFALSSRQEGLPVALMEAMASGLPSVVTRVGGMPEIVDQGVEGLLVQPGDTEALSVALGRLVAGTPLRARMSAAARERARHFDAAGAQRAIEAVYERVLAAREVTGSGPIAVRASVPAAAPLSEPAP